MLPYVVIHNAVSIDGRMDHLNVNMELYYSLISTWKEDLTLCGSETMLKAELDAWEHDGSTNPSCPLLAVVDSRGRFRKWSKVVPSMYWREGIALCSESTPRSHLEYLKKEGIEVMTAGEERVDLRAALERLADERSVKVIRVDSGGALNGALLRAGLVDEVSVMVQPQLIGGTSPSSILQVEDLGPGDRPAEAELMSSETLEGGVVWLRYRMLK
jgi:2,5-diamino-6-(ribosylamino)-4(3H)-pyrimidinone 5'-phosphate reductase